MSYTEEQVADIVREVLNICRAMDRLEAEGHVYPDDAGCGTGDEVLAALSEQQA